MLTRRGLPHAGGHPAVPLVHVCLVVYLSHLVAQGVSVALGKARGEPANGAVPVAPARVTPAPGIVGIEADLARAALYAGDGGRQARVNAVVVGGLGKGAAVTLKRVPRVEGVDALCPCGDVQLTCVVLWCCLGFGGGCGRSLLRGCWGDCLSSCPREEQADDGVQRHQAGEEKEGRIGFPFAHFFVPALCT